MLELSDMTEKEKEGLKLITDYHADPDRKIDPAANRAKELTQTMSAEEKTAAQKNFRLKIKAGHSDNK